MILGSTRNLADACMDTGRLLSVELFLARLLHKITLHCFKDCSMLFLREMCNIFLIAWHNWQWFWL